MAASTTMIRWAYLIRCDTLLRNAVAPPMIAAIDTKRPPRSTPRATKPEWISPHSPPFPYMRTLIRNAVPPVRLGRQSRAVKMRLTTPLLCIGKSAFLGRKFRSRQSTSVRQKPVCEPVVHNAERYLRHSSARRWVSEWVIAMLQRYRFCHRALLLKEIVSLFQLSNPQNHDAVTGVTFCGKARNVKKCEQTRQPMKPRGFRGQLCCE